MRRVWAVVVMSVAAGTVPGLLDAQASPPRQSQPPAGTVPKEKLPPKGMCRVWVDGVPASRQPAPTDCASAVRNRPPNARVIFPAERPAPRATPSNKGTTRPSPPPSDTTRRRKPPTKPPA